MFRKRQSPLEAYITSLTNLETRESKRTYFYSNLRHFYRRRWGCPLKLPNIQGVKIDLFDLYETVTSLGGWQKVNSTEKWNEVLLKLSFDPTIQNSDYALRLIYMRYLGKFEQIEFGSENDNDDIDLMGNRLKLKANILGSSILTESPITIPKTASRSSAVPVPDYEKLGLSLMSGLPNEVDFAINIITLLSHPGPYTMKFSECPKLITLMVAHCCPMIVCSDHDKGNQLTEFGVISKWEEQLGYKFQEFWSSAGLKNLNLAKMLNIDFDKNCDSGYVRLFEDDKLDLHVSLNWRIFSILAVFRNLSFDECNKGPLAENFHLIKFLLLCLNSRWKVLCNNAFDTLSNIASEIDLSSDDAIFHEHLLMEAVSDGLSSSDQFKFLRAIEMLGGLCSLKSNEAIICEFLNNGVLNQIFTLLTHKDILMCVTILEALLQITQLGKRSCDLISEFTNSIRIFMKLLTIDGASILGGTMEQARIKIGQIHGPTGQVHPYVSKRFSNLPTRAQMERQVGQIGHSQEHSTFDQANAGAGAPSEVVSMVPNSQISSSADISECPVVDYMCEWECCGKCFSKPETLLYHNTYVHLLKQQPKKQLPAKKGRGRTPKTVVQIEVVRRDKANNKAKATNTTSVAGTDELFVCKWPLCTDAVPRALWSMVTHLQERHCTEANMQNAAKKRHELGHVNYIAYLHQHQSKPQRDPPMNPGYSKHAAIEAIRRNSGASVAKELSDDQEGPVTKSVRLTTSLILRNIAKYSSIGRTKMQSFESFLSSIAFSRMESGIVLSQCLCELAKHSRDKVDTKSDQNLSLRTDTFVSDLA